MRRMKRRIGAILLASILAAGLLAGCGSQEVDAEDSLAVDSSNADSGNEEMEQTKEETKKSTLEGTIDTEYGTGFMDENVIVTVTGGVEPYTYQWSVREVEGVDEQGQPVWGEWIDLEEITGPIYETTCQVGIEYRCTVTDATGEWKTLSVSLVDATPEELERYGEIPNEKTFEEFIKNRSYLKEGWDVLPAEYATVDIDQDGKDELIVMGEDEEGFRKFRVYRQGNTVEVLSCDRMSLYGENDGDMTLFYAFGAPTYSKKYKSLVVTYPRPTAAGGADTFYTLKNKQMRLQMDLEFTADEANNAAFYYTKFDAQGGEESLSQEKYQAMLRETTTIDFQPLFS